MAYNVKCTFNLKPTLCLHSFDRIVDIVASAPFCLNL